MNIYWVISWALSILYLSLMLIYRLGFKKLPYFNLSQDTKQNNLHSNNHSIVFSIIIPARNEAENIQSLIESILQNDFDKSKYEIILINDFSEDETATIAAKAIGSQGVVLNLSDFLTNDERINAYKKKALEIAIQHSKGENIITTDADCIIPNHWLKNFEKAYENTDIQFVAAPVDFIPAGEREDVCYYFQSLDFMTMQGINMSAAQFNLGNMCNGANLSFRKSAFENVNGYQGIDNIASGDDMLLMYKIQKAFPKGIFYLKSKDAIVRTKAQPSWTTFLNQRIRWSSKADKYDDKKLFWILLLVYLYNLNFLIIFILGLLHKHYFILLLELLAIKTAIELYFLFPVSKFFSKEKELSVFPFLQPLHILYIISAGFLGKFGKYQWKGRTVK